MIAGVGSEPFYIVIRMDGLLEFADEWKHSIKIKVGGLWLKVLPLERILVSKQAANRPKDHRVMAVLRNALQTSKTLKKKQVRRTPTAQAKNKGEKDGK